MKRILIFSITSCIVSILLLQLSSCGSGSAQDSFNTSSPPPQSMINQDDDDAISDNSTAYNATSPSVAEDVNPPSTSPPMTAKQMKGAEEILKSVSDQGVSSVDAKFVFKLHCAVCHGFKGNAKVNGATDLTKSRTTLVESVAHINYGRGLMTPYNVMLSKEEIVAVAKYSQALR